MSIAGTDDFLKAARALNEAGDREIRKAVYRGFRSAARPLGEAMIANLAGDMPKRGGLSARVAGSKPSIRNATTGKNPRVEIILRTSTGYKLKPMDEGHLRHKVFGRNRWVNQSVPSGGATRAFNAGAPAVRMRLIRELNQVMTDTARKV